jgi:hypothetical protein
MFVYSVVKDFPDEMMQASYSRASYIHTGAFSYGLKAFEHHYLTSVVIIHSRSPNLFFIS